MKKGHFRTDEMKYSYHYINVLMRWWWIFVGRYFLASEEVCLYIWECVSGSWYIYRKARGHENEHGKQWSEVSSDNNLNSTPDSDQLFRILPVLLKLADLMPYKLSISLPALTMSLLSLSTKQNCITWKLRIMFYLVNKTEDISPRGSISSNPEQTALRGWGGS